MSTIAPISSTTTYQSAQSLTLDLKKEIGALSAEQIEVLAKAIVVRIMTRMDIDIIPAKGPVVITASDGSPQIISELPKFNPRSKMFEALLDNFTLPIQQEFATPALFIEKGMNFSLFAKDNSGILDRIPDTNFEFRLNKVKQKNQWYNITLSALSLNGALAFQVSDKLSSGSYCTSAPIKDFEEGLKTGFIL